MVEVKFLLLALGSMSLSGLVLANAFFQKKQFYPSVVFLTKSNPSMAVLYLQAFVLVLMMGKLLRKIFFGRLRAAELEHLVERWWYAITETCLAFTVFRDDFSPKFVALFTLLLFLKSFHWLAEDRVDFMERSPIISLLFHMRVVVLLAILTSMDCLFISRAYHSTLFKGPSVQLVFGFEYTILFLISVNIFSKYILHSIDLQSENPWLNKQVYMLYIDLFLGFCKVLVYLVFLMIMVKVHTFPLFAIRPMYLTMRSFKKSLNDAIMSRRAIRNLNSQYPDATEAELEAGDNVCIICRETMSVPGCKKLPCSHILHVNCLRSWFLRQQTCPICRRDILQPAPQPNVVPQQDQRPVVPPAQPFIVPGWPDRQIPPADANNQPPQASANSVPVSTASLPTMNANIPTMTSIPTMTTMPHLSGMPAMPGMPPIPGMPAMPGFPQIPGMPASSPVFMPPMGFLVPPPMPSCDHVLSDEELSHMEGTHRAAIEERIRCLKSIQTLLDAAVARMNQYTQIFSAMPNYTFPAQASQSSPESSPSKTQSDEADNPKSSPVKNNESLSDISSDISIETLSSQIKEFKQRCLEDSEIKLGNEDADVFEYSGLEGAVGYDSGAAQFSSKFVQDNDASSDVSEMRKRRVEKLSKDDRFIPELD